MAKLSVNQASKLFDVSRPTLTKALASGKISGEKDPERGWQIDTAELGRLWKLRGGGADPLHEAAPDKLHFANNPLEDDLRRELQEVKARLAVAEALADERGKRLDQLVPLLSSPVRRRRWWFW